MKKILFAAVMSLCLVGCATTVSPKFAFSGDPKDQECINPDPADPSQLCVERHSVVPNCQMVDVQVLDESGREWVFAFICSPAAPDAGANKPTDNGPATKTIK